MPKISKSQLKKALSAAEEARPEYQNRFRADPSKHPKLLNSQRAVEKILASSFSKAGLDLKKLDRIRQQHRTELNRVLKKVEADAIKRSSKIKRTLQASIASKREALEHLATVPLPHAPPYLIILDKPFLIWATPHSVISDSHIESWNSWAKTKFVRHKMAEDDRNYEKVSFYFLWENPSDYHAVIDAATYLALNGYCRAEAEAGIFVRGLSTLNIDARFTLWQMWNEPANSVTGAVQQVLYLSASGGVFFDDVESANVYGDYDLDYQSFIVPPWRVAVLEVAMYVSYAVYNPAPATYVHVNFEEYDWEVSCPFLVVSLLTPPPMSPVTAPVAVA